jgi:Cu(I)/Ag(I) efflux system membrane fusion protein
MKNDLHFSRRNFCRTFTLGLLTTAFAGRLRADSKPGDIDYWTCAMHPSVHAHEPGKCPICSMTLVPVYQKSAMAAMAATKGDAAAREFVVPIERQQQIGVTYGTVEMRELSRTIRAVGTVAENPLKRWSYVARLEAYVQSLQVASAGESVKAGQPLLTIYSPELLAAEREFVNWLKARDAADSALAKSAAELSLSASRQRLEQWNITPEQIAALEKSRVPSEFLTLLSPFAGVVESVAAQQGAKVEIGETLVTVLDLSQVWVWADFYENELSFIAKGCEVKVSADAFAGEEWSGHLEVTMPKVDSTTRAIRARVSLPNPGEHLLPGMYVNVDCAVSGGKKLAVPASAIIPTGRESLVFVDKGEGRLEPRGIQLGGRFGDFYEVRSGLSEGERVVTSANFLIDAEAQVQGAVKNFQPLENGK